MEPFCAKPKDDQKDDDEDTNDNMGDRDGMITSKDKNRNSNPLGAVQGKKSVCSKAKEKHHPPEFLFVIYFSFYCTNHSSLPLFFLA